MFHAHMLRILQHVSEVLHVQCCTSACVSMISGAVIWGQDEEKVLEISKLYSPLWTAGRAGTLTANFK